MDSNKQSFLAAVLSDSGASALIKACDRSPALEFALVPRAILAWVSSAPRYEGQIPGIENTTISFSKSEAGFTGSVGIDGKSYNFEDASVFYVAASLGVALGVQQGEAPAELRDIDLDRLGKSIAVMAKIKRVGEELKKAIPGAPNAMKKQLVPVAKYEKEDKEVCSCGCTREVHTMDDGGCHGCGCDKFESKKAVPVKKDEKGNSAAPLAPTAPVAPTSTLPTQPKATKTKLPQLPGTSGAKTPKPPTAKTGIKPVGVKLTRAEADHQCPSCGLKQFSGNKFQGCLCFRALQKSVKVVGANPTGVLIEFNMSSWDRPGILTFLESVGRRR